jgi:hypothetical protein
MTEQNTSEDDSKTIELISQEGESYHIPLKIAKLSETIKNLINDQEDYEAQEIPLPQVKSSVLAKVIEFLQHYDSEPMGEIDKVRFFYAPLTRSLINDVLAIKIVEYV